MNVERGGGGKGVERGEGGSRPYDGPYLVVKKGGGEGQQSNNVLFPTVLILCTTLPLASLSPISCSAVEASLDTKMDQVGPNRSFYCKGKKAYISGWGSTSFEGPTV